MPIDYAEVMRDLEAREGQLLTELNTLRSAKPAVKLLMETQLAQAALIAPRKKYAGVGTKGALRDIYSNTSELLSREHLSEMLKSHGWTTESKDPMSVISATLSQLVSSGELEKIADRWRTPPILGAATANDEHVYLSQVPSNSFAATNYPVLATVQKRLDELSADVSQA